MNDPELINFFHFGACTQERNSFIYFRDIYVCLFKWKIIYMILWIKTKLESYIYKLDYNHFSLFQINNNFLQKSMRFVARSHLYMHISKVQYTCHEVHPLIP